MPWSVSAQDLELLRGLAWRSGGRGETLDPETLSELGRAEAMVRGGHPFTHRLVAAAIDELRPLVDDRDIGIAWPIGGAPIVDGVGLAREALAGANLGDHASEATREAIGWLISEDRHYYGSRAYHDPYARYDHYAPRYRSYIPPPPRHREYVVVERRTEPAVAPDNAEFAGRDCRMTREYQTTVEIDGEQHEAYGTRCLTADGSWVLGRPNLVPEFPNQ